MEVDNLTMGSVLEIHRTTRLPFPGSVLVNPGDLVHAGDVIAEAFLPGELLVLDIARGLGIPPDETISCLVRDLGEELKQGDVIAQCEGTFTRLVRAPANGIFIECHQGRGFLATGQHLQNARAGLKGFVEEIIPEIGAIISARGYLLQGVWGNNRIGEGKIKVIDSSFDAPLTAAMINNMTSDQVLMVGLCLHEAALMSIVENDIAGLVLGALAPELFSIAIGLELPLIVLQGFGDLQPDPSNFKLFKSKEDETASLNACTPNLLEGNRPEVIIPDDSVDFQEEQEYREKLSLGQRVRLLSGRSFGQSGDIVALSEMETRFESGVVAPEARVRLQSGEILTIPCQNLQVLS